MIFYVENETNAAFEFDVNELVEAVLKEACAFEKCPYEIEVNICITDEVGIRAYNREYRKIDKATDVLSFPAVDYDSPADFSYVTENEMAYLNPQTQELMLGDIILCEEKIREQAKEYGHSTKREFAFLLTHSMLHLFGYDHMEEQEENVMFERQEQILQNLGITR